MAGRTNDRIYLITQGTSKWGGKILLFDVVKSYNTTMNATTTSHSIEAENRSISDHTYNRNVNIQLTGYISDSWDSEFKSNIDKKWNNYADNLQDQLFSTALDNESAENSAIPGWPSITQAVEEIMETGEGPKALDYYGIPTTADASLQQELILQAYKIFESKKAVYTQASNKSILSENITNDDSNNGAINTTEQAEELLQAIRGGRLLCTLAGKWRTLENMVMSNFTNPLKAGPGSQAYYVTLSFEQQRSATTNSETKFYYAPESEITDDTKKRKANTKDQLDSLKRMYSGLLTSMTASGTSPFIDPRLKSTFATDTVKSDWINETSQTVADGVVNGTIGDGHAELNTLIKQRKTDFGQ